MAELEEGATLIAHKVDEQVLGAAARSCRVEAGSAWLDMENRVSRHDSLWVSSPQHHQEAFSSREDFLDQPKKSSELSEPGWAQTIRYILVHMLSVFP